MQPHFKFQAHSDCRLEDRLVVALLAATFTDLTGKLDVDHEQVTIYHPL